MHAVLALIVCGLLFLGGCNRQNSQDHRDDATPGSVAGTGVTSGEGSSSTHTQQKGTGTTTTTVGGQEGSESSPQQSGGG
jgi:hypothetical protein